LKCSPQTFISAKAAMFHGGKGSDGKMTSVFSNIFTGNKQMCPGSEHLPQSDNDWAIGIHSMAYLEPYLVICGGEDTAGNIKSTNIYLLLVLLPLTIRWTELITIQGVTAKCL
jgi:hypothetical protein